MRQIAAFTILLLCSCQYVGGFKSFEEGNAISQGGNAGAAGNGGTPAVCKDSDAPGKHGPTMKGIGFPDGHCVWIDETEVTFEQYQEFLDSKPSVTTQAQFCQWNDQYEQDEACLTDDNDIAYNSSSKAPIVCVDQCDALAYCEWAGKQLCKREYTGSPKTETDIWYAACAGYNDSNVYPYGDEVRTDICNGNDKEDNGCPSACTLAPVGTLSQCTNSQGVFDLVGNAAEWADSCSGDLSAKDQCVFLGGWVARPSGENTCDVFVAATRDTKKRYIGFRCCAEE